MNTCCRCDKVHSYSQKYYCRECWGKLNKKYRIRWNSENPGREKLRHRKNALKTNFGMTLEDYNTLFTRQDGRCAICGKHQSDFTKALHIDHDHKTGSIRGLLCNECNHGVGNFKDDQTLLQRAIIYLSKFALVPRS
jgi:hypothetical protein